MDYFLAKINEYSASGRFTLDIRKRFVRRFYLGEIDEVGDREVVCWEPVRNIEHEIQSWANNAIYYATRGNEDGDKLTFVMLHLAQQNMETLKEAILKVAEGLSEEFIAEEHNRSKEDSCPE